MATTTTASAPTAHNPKGLAIALGICIPILVVLVILILYLLFRQRNSDLVYQAVTQPVTYQPTEPVQHIPWDLIRCFSFIWSESKWRNEKSYGNFPNIFSSARSKSAGRSSCNHTSADDVTNTAQDVFRNMEWELTCPICMNIFHNPVSVINEQVSQNTRCCECISLL